MGILLLIMLGGAVIGGEVLARLLPRWGYPRASSPVRLLVLVAASLYAGALLTVSLSSQERTLPRGETLRFCGFYLDCHMGVAVDGVVHRESAGTTSASGIYFVVSVRVSSNARRATLQLYRPEFTVIDKAGRRYSRALDAERALAAEAGEAPMVRPVRAGESYLATIVFDLPEGVASPRLQVKDVNGVDRVLEAILIGDDDSVLHKPTTLALR
jgi:hypothetical protein